MAAGAGSERELLDGIALQEDLTNKTIDILKERLRSYDDRKNETGVKLLGVPSYDHLIYGNNLKRYYQMLEFERKLKEVYVMILWFMHGMYCYIRINSMSHHMFTAGLDDDTRCIL